MASFFENPWGIGGELYPNRVLDISETVNLDSLLNSQNITFDIFFGKKSNRTAYVNFLKEGNEIIKNISFGSPTGGQPGITTGDEKFDLNFWYEAMSSEFGWGDLVLLPDKSPSEAIFAIFNLSNIGQWSLDCARYTDLLHIYANLKMRGVKKFNKLYKDKSFIFSPHDSTASEVIKDVHRPNKQNSTYYTGQREYQKVYNSTEEQLIMDSPIGNTMIFSNSNAPNGSAWANENTIKVGSDEFIAHGFGSPNIFSKQEILENLAKSNIPSLSGDNLKKYINDYLYLKQSLWINF